MTVSIKVVEKGRNKPGYSLDADLGGKFTFEELQEFTRQVVIATAKTVLKEEQAKGFDKEPRVRVDNRFDRMEEEVKPFGKIEYFARVDFNFALLQMYEIIKSLSVVVTGQYRSGNVVFVNNVEVARSTGQLRRYVVDKASAGGFKAGDLIRFINVNPYARRLENKGYRRGVRGPYANKNTKRPRSGKSRKTGNRIIIPNGTYSLAARNIKSQFKQVSKLIAFRYFINGTSGINIRDKNGQLASFKTGKRGAIGRPYLYPSISFRVDPQGINPQTNATQTVSSQGLLQ